MANSKMFKTTFEKVAKEVTCNFCQEIIWNSPIYESIEELIMSTFIDSMQSNTLSSCFSIH